MIETVIKVADFGRYCDYSRTLLFICPISGQDKDIAPLCAQSVQL
jgi:hypothetical protein